MTFVPDDTKLYCRQKHKKRERESACVGKFAKHAGFFCMIFSDSLFPFQIQSRLMSKSAGAVVDEVTFKQKGISTVVL